MRRRARNLLRLCSAVSLLLFVAVCVLWVRSHFVIDRLMDNRIPSAGERSWHAVNVRGQIWVAEVRGVSQAENRATRNWSRDWLLVATGDEGPVGPNVPVEGVFVRQRWVTVRCWVPAGLLGVGAVPFVRAVLRRSRRQGRERAGLCLACGYDLRATTGRCPECGTPAVSEARA